jgi:sugar/nucleoside kinase (ribokinase family)
MSNKYDIVVLGDVNLDYVVANDLPFSLSNLIENGKIHWEEINEIPGGSGLNFCAFARETGFRSLLLSKVGEDTAGMVITKWLKQKKILLPSQWTTKSPTGKALIMRDNLGIRLLINNKKNSNHLLDLKDIEENKKSIASCRMLYVSGYCISESQTPRYKATLQAMEYAKSSVTPPVIVFDVVPHRIYEKFSFDEFLKKTKDVDILISEVATMRRFLDLGEKSETIDDQMAKDTAESISQFYDRFMLRFGASGCDKQILVDKKARRSSCEETGYAQASDKRGFGDKIAISALREFFGVLPK